MMVYFIILATYYEFLQQIIYFLFVRKPMLIVWVQIKVKAKKNLFD